MGDWQTIETAVAKVVVMGKFFIILGSDHSTTIPVMRKVDKVITGSLDIIHIDAHFDLCDEMDGNCFAHGCTERRALDLKAVGGVENIYFLGIRSIESDELAFFNANLVQMFSSKQIDQLGTAQVIDTVLATLSRFDHIYIKPRY
jgi:arginase family enzyme